MIAMRRPSRDPLRIGIFPVAIVHRRNVSVDVQQQCHQCGGSTGNGSRACATSCRMIVWQRVWRQSQAVPVSGRDFGVFSVLGEHAGRSVFPSCSIPFFRTCRHRHLDLHFHGHGYSPLCVSVSSPDFISGIDLACGTFSLLLFSVGGAAF